MLPFQNCFWSLLTQCWSLCVQRVQIAQDALELQLGDQRREVDADGVADLARWRPAPAAWRASRRAGTTRAAILMSGWSSSNLAMNASYQSPCWPGLPWIQSWSRIMTREPLAAGCVAATAAAAWRRGGCGRLAAGALVGAAAAGCVGVAAGAGGRLSLAPPHAARIAAPGMLPSASAAPCSICRRESRPVPPAFIRCRLPS